MSALTPTRLPGHAAPTRPAPSRMHRARTRAAWTLLAPALVLSAAFLVVPLVYAVMTSLRGQQVTGGGLGVRTEVFVGFANYLDSLTNPELWRGAVNILLYGALSVPVTLGAALVFALALDHPRVRFARFSRIVIFVPFAVPGIIATLNWGFIYLPGISPLNQVGAALGIDVPSLLGPGYVFLAVANIAVWGGVGFNMIVLFTALRGVPAEVYDAARVDGCSEWQIARHVKIPLIVPGIVLTGLFSLIGTLQVFSEPTALAKLTNAIDPSWVPMMSVYDQAFTTNDVYGSAATSILVTLVTLVASLLLLRVLQRRAFGAAK